ncbi:ADP-ribose glycohydrolase ARH3-like [Coccinella septempunctata]|uniref:ADP-ribose glycohydrolase ARH3-like n=1 Tax=Coccinella septempunctata TaxID=41139 RepID=UPI001D0997A5|nr:ADP-ribose glycohydrolase ARH3-like [Coccinella septempunctata]
MIRRMMPTHNCEVLRKKFRGCLLGSLLGDCLGAPFEGDFISAGEKIVIKNYFDKLETPDFKGPIKQYTDDTAMTRCVAKALIDKPEPDFTLMAKLFVKEYFLEPKRGYGQNVITVFKKLKQSRFQDIFKPASEQFNGSGSLGNGGAMRIAPLALYFFDKDDLLVDAATKATKITHTHPLGVNGALLQCMAIQQCFMTKHGDKIDVHKFVEELLHKMKPFEYEEDEDFEEILEKPYREKLLLIQNLLHRTYENDELYDEVLETLGNNISALESVPTAIYCFLKACAETPEMKDIFRNAVEYAITLGGDTDTIASMTGAIAGAYVGEEHLNKNVIENCEKHKETIEMADNLLAARQEETAEMKNS